MNTAKIQISHRIALQNLRVMHADVDKAYTAACNTRIRGERPSERAMRLSSLLEEKATLEMAIRLVEADETKTRPTIPLGGY